MRRFFSWFPVILKRQVKNISFLALMIVVPLVTVICSNLSSFNSVSIETVALYAEDDDECTARIIDGILNLHTEFNYISAESDEQIREMVRTRKALCGFVFKKNLSERFRKEKYNGNVDCIVRQDSVFSDAACEQIFSKYLKEMAYMQAVEIIDETVGVKENADGYFIREKYEELMNRDETEFLKIVFLDDKPDSDTVTGSGVMIFSISGVMAIIMLLGALMGIGTMITDRTNGVLVPPVRGHELMIRILSIMIPVILLACSTWVTLTVSRGIAESGRIFLAVMVYSVLLIAFSLGLTVFVKTMPVMIALEVLLITGSLVLCPVFFDIGSAVPVIRVLKFFMPPQWLLMML